MTKFIFHFNLPHFSWNFFSFKIVFEKVSFRFIELQIFLFLHIFTSIIGIYILSVSMWVRREKKVYYDNLRKYI